MNRFLKKSGCAIWARLLISTRYASALCLTILVFALAVPLISRPAIAQTAGSQAAFGTSFRTKSKVPGKVFGKALASYLKTIKFPGAKSKNLSSSKKVTWKLAIKTLCRAKKWTKKKTFSECLAFAKKQKWLTQPLKENLKPKTKITYRQLAALMDRAASLTSAPEPLKIPAPPATLPTQIPSSESASKTVTIPPPVPSPLSFTPVPETTIAADFFTNIRLTAPLPTRFYKNELYFVEGDLTGGKTSDEAFIFVCPENGGCDNSLDFLEDTTGGGTHFKIPVLLTETGNFQIGIIPGNSGQSRIENISVLHEPPQNPGGDAATMLDVRYNKGAALFTWNGSGAFTRLAIFQGNTRKDFFSRQNIRTAEIPSEHFSQFQKGEAHWFIEQDSARSSVQTITLTIQEMRKIKNDEVEVKSLQEVFSAPGRFTFTGRAKSAIDKKTAATLPNGQVQEFEFAENNITAGRDFSVSFDMTENGTYIFEINNPLGSAVINVPIYVGPAIPLLPDYFALEEQVLNTTPIRNLDEERKKMLELLNEDRTAHNLPALALSSELNAIAQSHSQNMVSRSFFGHDDPEGNGPDDRRRAAKYAASIRENLAKSTSPMGAERGLMRSPIHRAAIIDPQMTKVGLGIVKNPEGYLIVTQNFSADPVIASTLPSIKTALIQKTQEKRIAESLPNILEDNALSAIAEDWSRRMTLGKFFATRDADGFSLVDAARDAGVRTSLQVHIVKAGEISQVEEQIIKQNGLLNSNNLKFGIGLFVSSLGEIALTTIYTP